MSGLEKVGLPSGEARFINRVPTDSRNEMKIFNKRSMPSFGWILLGISVLLLGAFFAFWEEAEEETERRLPNTSIVANGASFRIEMHTLQVGTRIAREYPLVIKVPRGVVLKQVSVVVGHGAKISKQPMRVYDVRDDWIQRGGDYSRVTVPDILPDLNRIVFYSPKKADFGGYSASVAVSVESTSGVETIQAGSDIVFDLIPLPSVGGNSSLWARLNSKIDAVLGL